MNKAILIGNLTKDPEHQTTQSGVSVCKMSIAVNRNFTDANGERRADYFNIVAWRGLADNCARFLSKGKKIAVVGSIQNRSYEKDNQTKYVTEIMADEIEFLSPQSENQKQQPEPQQKRKISDMQPVDNDDLPF
ncbi:MAG: single-stranded DNA-binding protein [Roseburia sp.]|nr:single-stranded DNA-binding protein [Roseburia sp.]